MSRWLSLVLQLLLLFWFGRKIYNIYVLRVLEVPEYPTYNSRTKMSTPLTRFRSTLLNKFVGTKHSPSQS